LLNIPRSLTIGDATNWTDSFEKYKASSASLSYTLVGSTRLVLNAIADGDNFVTSISSIQSNTLVAGTYSAQAAIANVGTIAVVQIQIKPNLAVVTLPYIAKTANQLNLEAAQKAYQNALNGVQEYEIAGSDGWKRKRRNYNLNELLDQVKYWNDRVIKEQFVNGDRPDPRIQKVGFV
jgi:hypothetical protein